MSKEDRKAIAAEKARIKYYENREAMLAKSREYYAKTIEVRRAYSKARYWADPEKAR